MAAVRLYRKSAFLLISVDMNALKKSVLVRNPDNAIALAALKWVAEVSTVSSVLFRSGFLLRIPTPYIIVHI